MEGWKNGLRTIEVLDMLMHPIVYFAKKGAGTEKFLYHELRHAGVPKKQIFRNVYVPTYDGKYTEIDVLVLSKKGFWFLNVKIIVGRFMAMAEQQGGMNILMAKNMIF